MKRVSWMANEDTHVLSDRVVVVVSGGMVTAVHSEGVSKVLVVDWDVLNEDMEGFPVWEDVDGLASMDEDDLEQFHLSQLEDIFDTVQMLDLLYQIGRVDTSLTTRADGLVGLQMRLVDCQVYLDSGQYHRLDPPVYDGMSTRAGVRRLFGWVARVTSRGNAHVLVGAGRHKGKHVSWSTKQMDWVELDVSIIQPASNTMEEDG